MVPFNRTDLAGKPDEFNIRHSELRMPMGNLCGNTKKKLYKFVATSSVPGKRLKNALYIDKNMEGGSENYQKPENELSQEKNTE